MSVAEARTEIKDLLEKADIIEKRYPDGEITKNEDLEEVKRILTEVDGLEAKLATLEDAESRRNRIVEGMERYSKPVATTLRPNAQVEEYEEGRKVDPGTQFINDRGYRELKNNGSFNSAVNRVQFHVTLKDGTSLLQWHKAIEQKLLIFGSGDSGGSFVQEDRLPGYKPLLQREINLMDLVPRLQTGSDTVEYVRQTTFTNNAAMTAEATATTGTSGKKPESAIAFEVKTVPVRSLPTWIPVTNRMLADAPAIRGIINQQLLLMLALKLEDQVVAGGGTGEDFEGILEDSDTNIQGKGADSGLDAIFKARTQVRVAGKGRPNAVALHPNDWQEIRLARENSDSGTLGGYLMGPPSQVGAVTTWGIPVVESEALTENTGVTADFNMAMALWDREQAAIRVGTIDDQFVRNMQTILAELRAAFTIFYPKMITRITGI